jgi:Protein of unknown function (DUF2839)
LDARIEDDNYFIFFKNSPMGEAKRRKENTGEVYGQEQRILAWLPLTSSQAQRFVQVTTKSAWVGIGGLALLWFTVRLIGPAAGWWTTQ